MRAAVFRGPRALEIVDHDEPRAGEHDVVVAVRACGVCGSDLHAFVEGGPVVLPGQVMGHEFAGEVIEVGGGVRDIDVGDRVAGLPIVACGECRRCVSGRRSLCDRWIGRSIGFGLPGAFAERVRIPDAVLGTNVHRLPDHVSYPAGALAEPLAVAVRAVDQSGARPGQAAVVLGLGSIGLQIVQVLRARGITQIVGVNRSKLRRDVATRLGVVTVAGGPGVVERIGQALAGREADVVFEASGVSDLVQTTLEVAAPGGVVVLVGVYGSDAVISPVLVLLKELTLRGSSTYMPSQFAEAVDLLASGRVEADPLITHRRGLEDTAAAFEDQLHPSRAVKAIVEIGD